MLRVLLVEDSEILAERLRETLGAINGVEVVDAVADETSAVGVAQERDIDVIVLDLQLKEGTGFGVLKRLGSRRPEVIVFTSFGLPEYQQKANSLGVQHFLVKSRDHEKLPELISEIAQRRLAQPAE